MAFKAKKRGMSGILEVAHECCLADAAGRRRLGRAAFTQAIHRCRLELGAQEVDTVFDYLEGATQDGTVDYSVLLRDMKANSLTQLRRQALNDIFTKLDFRQQGEVDLKLLATLFNAKNHFDVKGGRRTLDEIEAQFRETIRLFSSLRSGSTLVDCEEFLDYWEYISATIQNDNHFDALLKTAFRYNELPTKGAKVVDVERFEKNNQKKQQVMSSNPLENSRMLGLIETVKAALLRGGVKKLFQFYQVIKHNDHDNDNRLACKEFAKSFHDMRLNIPEADVTGLFELFDLRKTGFLDIPQFMCTLVPELDARRQRVVDDLLAALAHPSDPQTVLLSNIKKFYFPRGHLDFVRKKRQDYDIKEEFFTVLQTFLGLSGGANEAIPRELALQFFEIYSLSFPDADEFCNNLIGSFRMDRICGTSKPGSLLPDHGSDFDQASVHKSKIQHPFGTQEDMPQSRPHTAQRPATASAQGLEAPASRNLRVDQEFEGRSLRDDRSIYDSQPSQARQPPQAPVFPRNGERTPSRRSEASPQAFGSPGQLSSDSRAQAYVPTFEEARSALVHQ